MESLRIEVTEPSQVGAARRAAVALAAHAGLGEADQARVALVATEAATNLVKHAREGQILARPATERGVPAIELLAIDRGGGLARPAQAFADGYSTRGTLGAGLGAMQRLSDGFAFYTSGAGLVLALHVEATGMAAGLAHGAAAAAGAGASKAAGRAAASGPDAGASAPGGAAEAAFAGPAAPPRMTTGARHPGLELGAVCVRKPGETVCGDDWAVVPTAWGWIAAVVDGLGHGPLAAAASHAALAALDAGEPDPERQMQRMHEALRPTRGAAAGVATWTGGQLAFCGVGNVVCRVLDEGRERQLVTHAGIVGHEMRKRAAFAVPLDAGGLAVLHSDGLTTQCAVQRHAGLEREPAGLIAGVLYREHVRGRDDATVVVVRAATRGLP